MNSELAVIDAPAETHERILPISEIKTMDEYLQNYGKILGKKAITALDPLHVPFRDPLPDFSDIPEHREPFPAQAHVIAAAMKMFNRVGSGFICGEMGTGKTLLGILSVHKHAQLSRRKGGKGGNYRALILCPDHLIGKWKREIEETLVDATITRFGPQGSAEEEMKTKRRKKGEDAPDPNSKATLRDVIALLDKRGGGQADRWTKPDGAEWFVLGRNQAKWLSDWAGMADEQKGFADVEGRLCEIATTAMIGKDADGNDLTQVTYHVPFPKMIAKSANAVSSKNRIVDTVAVMDANGYQSYDDNGRAIRKSVVSRVHYCPSCGQIVTDKKGVPVSRKDLQKGKSVAQKTCRGTYLQMLASGPDKKSHGLDRIPVPDKLSSIGGKIGHELKHGGYTWVVKACGERLYNYTAKPYRWSPAMIIQRKCKRMFDYLVIDEVHEQKSDESAQSMACGKLISSVRHILALTGTIIGGYANHLYPLLMRITPTTLRNEGFEWGKDLEFSKQYGRIDKIITTKEDDDSGPAIRGNVKSMRRAKSGQRSERVAVRPGVMPTMFGRHMIGASIFIALDEMDDELPDLFEYVGGDLPLPAAELNEHEKDRWEEMENGWFDTACDMRADQEDEYKRVMSCLEFANKELLRKGSMKLLGTYLWTGMDYPDKPFGWDHDPEVKKAFLAHQATLPPEEALSLKLPHTVGFWDIPGSRKIETFVGVVTPKDCPEDTTYPKEKKLIDICLKQKSEGRQTWVYVQMTGKRNIQPRLQTLLEAQGLKVGVMRSKDVEPIEREEWITKHGRDFDVMISHPQLVSTGLDLFSKGAGGHNYSTLVFYETGYNLFTMRQAARRAWRIGQPHDCRVYYMYYKETMQHKAMSLMSRKMSASQALEGDFTEEGLAAMAGEENLQMSLAKNLSERIDDSDMQRGWMKIKGGPKKLARPTSAVAAMSKGAKPSALDTLPIELQMVAETILENQGKPVHPGALAEFPRLAATLAALQEGFDPTGANNEFAEHENDSDDDDTADGEEEAAVVEPMEFDDTFDEEYVPDPVYLANVPVLTEEILAKMFANMMANGLSVG